MENIIVYFLLLRLSLLRTHGFVFVLSQKFIEFVNFFFRTALQENNNKENKSIGITRCP